MIDLYFSPTSNALRAAIILEECALPYRIVPIDLASNEHKSPEIARLNPARMVPFLVDGKHPNGEPFVVSQSAAILVYCAEKVGRFLPNDAAARIAVFQWTFAAVTDIGPTSTLTRSLDSERVPDPSAANAAFFTERLVKLLEPFDAALAHAPYLAKDISIADFALYPSIAPQRRSLETKGGLSHLWSWADRMAMRPAIQRALQLQSTNFGFLPRTK